MSVLWTIMIAASTLVLMPLAFDWTRELRRWKGHEIVPAGDGGAGGGD